MIYCQKFLFKNNKKITVACSGGVDSIVVSHFLKKKMKYEVELFHFNHRLRSQNDKMEKAVIRFAEYFNMPYQVHARSKDNNIIVEGRSLEAKAHEWRLKAIRYHVNGILVLAHHLDDCIESYFMNFLKGCPEYSPMPIRTLLKDSNAEIVRPFLLVSKKDIQKYAEENDLLRFVEEDETNTDNSIRRNWTRNVILPEIEKIYGGLPKVVAKKVKKYYNKEKQKLCY